MFPYNNSLVRTILRCGTPCRICNEIQNEVVQQTYNIEDVTQRSCILKNSHHVFDSFFVVSCCRE